MGRRRMRMMRINGIIIYLGVERQRVGPERNKASLGCHVGETLGGGGQSGRG